MKILHVVASYLPATRYGGTIVSVHGLCRALAARGHDVHVYTTSVDGPGDSPVPHDVPVNRDAVKVWYFRSTHARRLYWAPGLGRALQAHVGEFDAVHVHAIYLWPLWKAAWTARGAGVPYVISPRGMLEKSLVDKKSALAKRALIRFIERPSLEHAAAIHVTSRREGDEIRSFGFALPPVEEIPNGVDLDNCPPGAVSPEVQRLIDAGPFVLFLGRLNWKKGLDRLIAALAHAPGVRVVVAGNDEDGYRDTLQALAVRHGVAGRWSFAGPVAGANKAALLARAQLLVLPSYSENFGNVVLEAMAAGRPVVVTPEVGLSAAVRDAGAGLVVDGTPQALGEALASLASDAEAQSAIGARGRALAEARYSWDAVAAQMERLYQTVQGSRPPC